MYAGIVLDVKNSFFNGFILTYLVSVKYKSN